jgi:hypothetical protein
MGREVTRESIAVVVGCALGALWLDFSPLHALHTADSLMSTLVSLVKWTPFYWGQNRFGMLLPLIAWPVREPVANLLVQTFFLCFTTLLAPFCVMRLAGFRTWIAAGTVGAATLMMLLPGETVAWIIFNPVGLSLCLAAVGYELLESPRAWPLGFALTVLALWVNIGLVLFVPLLVVLARGFQRRPAIAWAVALVLVRVAMRVWGEQRTRLNPAWPSEWPHAWLELGSNVARDYGVGFAAVVLGGALMLAMRRKNTEWRRVGAVVVSCAVFFVVTGTSRHVADNLFNSRYVSVLAFALPGALWAQLQPAPVKGTGVAAGVLMLVVSALRFGLPTSPSALLDQRFAAQHQRARAAGCTHVVGRYWDVWPVELMSLRDGGPIIWAISERAGPTREQWQAVSPAKWCAFAGDVEVDDALKRYELERPPLTQLP